MGLQNSRWKLAICGGPVVGISGGGNLLILTERISEVQN